MKIKILKKFQKVKCSNMRKVVMTVLQRDLSQFKNKKVLEIGCGNWDFAKKILEKNSNEWWGLDVTPSKIANALGTVDKIPFPDKTFDLVLCNQSMEHWYEYGVSWDTALKEINRVLKIDGIFMANAPIHYHGHPYFLFDKINKIRRIVCNYFDSVQFIEEYYNKKSKGWKDAKLPDFLFKKKDFSYQIFITAKKGIIIDYYSNYKYRFRKTKVILRFIKAWLSF